jgi:hypothetical protein
MDDPDLPQTLSYRFFEIFLHDGDDLLRGKNVQVDVVLDRDPVGGIQRLLLPCRFPITLPPPDESGKISLCRKR